MKRLLLCAVLAAVLLLQLGCGRDSAAPGFSREDLSLTINGAQYRINMDINTVIANLGEQYEYAEGMSCDYDGLDKTYLYDVAEFYTNPLAAGDMISEIYTKSPSVTTSRGISVGASRKDVLAAYGEDCEDEGDLLLYRLPGERDTLCFELEDGAVWAIYLTNQSV